MPPNGSRRCLAGCGSRGAHNEAAQRSARLPRSVHHVRTEVIPLQETQSLLLQGYECSAHPESFARPFGACYSCPRCRSDVDLVDRQQEASFSW